MLSERQEYTYWLLLAIPFQIFQLALKLHHGLVKYPTSNYPLSSMLLYPRVDRGQFQRREVPDADDYLRYSVPHVSRFYALIR